MKTLKLFMLATLLMAIATSGQKILRYDYAKKKFTNIDSLKNIKKGETYQVVVENINLNLYKVSINSKDSIIATKVDSFPTFGIASITGISSILDKIKLSNTATSKSTNPSKRDNNQQHLEYFGSTRQENYRSEKDNNLIDKKIKEKIKEHKKFLDKKDQVIKSTKDSIEQIVSDFATKCYDYKFENEAVKTKLGFKGFKEFNLKKEQDDIAQIRLSLSKSRKEIENMKSNYQDFTSLDNVSAAMKKGDELKEADKNLTTAYDTLLKSIDDLSQSISSDKVSTMANTIIDSENNATWKYISSERQLLDDVAKIDIMIVPQDSKSKLMPTTAHYEFPQKSAMFIGLSMSFYYANFKDEIFSTIATVIDSNTTEYKLVNENNKRGELGVVSLIHLGWKPFHDKYTDFGFSLVTGPALSLTKDIKPRIAFGGGLCYGEKNMFTLNVLYMGGYIQKLSNAYTANGVYSTDPNNPTISKLSGSFAFSLGYIYQF